MIPWDTWKGWYYYSKWVILVGFLVGVLEWSSHVLWRIFRELKWVKRVRGKKDHARKKKWLRNWVFKNVCVAVIITQLENENKIKNVRTWCFLPQKTSWFSSTVEMTTLLLLASLLFDALGPEEERCILKISCSESWTICSGQTPHTSWYLTLSSRFQPRHHSAS